MGIKRKIYDTESEWLNFVPEIYESADDWEYMGEDDDYEYFASFSENDGENENIDDWEDADGDDYEYAGEDEDYEYFACFSSADEDVEDDDEYEYARARRKARRIMRKVNRRAKKIARVGKRSAKKKARITKRIARKIKRVAKKIPTARRAKKVSRLTKRSTKIQKKVPKRVQRLTRSKAKIEKRDVKKLQTINRNSIERNKIIARIRSIRGAKIENMDAEDYFAKKMGLSKPSREWSVGELKKIYSYASKENILMEANKNTVALGVYEANKSDINEPYADWYVKNRMAFRALQKIKKKEYNPIDYGKYLKDKYNKRIAKVPDDIRSQRKIELQQMAENIKEKEKGNAERIKAKVDDAVNKGQDVDEVDTEDTAITVPGEITKPVGLLNKAVKATDNAIYKFFKLLKL